LKKPLLLSVEDREAPLAEVDDRTLTGWLIEAGGAVVCGRAARELPGCIACFAQDRLAMDALVTPIVQKWVERLSLGDLEVHLDSLDEKLFRRLGGMVHGGADRCLENVLGKLAEFGLRTGIPGEAGQDLDRRLLALPPIFRWKSDWKQDTAFQNAWETLVKSVFAWGLLRLGYQPDAVMGKFLLSHLDTCHKIARDQVYDIYVGEAELAGLPKAWAGKPILKQEVMGDYWLPYIHDIYIFAHLPAGFLDETGNRKVDELIRYILDPRFQALHEGYGYAWIKERRTCYSWGWSPHLPGYNGLDFDRPYHTGNLVQRLELMAHFPAAHGSAWFRRCLDHLEEFRTPQGTYLFPGNYLRESEGYYVSGYHMGLGENRHKKTGLEIESTFRMLKIRSLIHA
jgi:hypothetical protein